MDLSNQDIKLLQDIFSASLTSSNGSNAARYRADNEQFIPNLDQLVSRRLLIQQNGNYSITLLALLHLAEQDIKAHNLMEKFDHVFASIRSHYKQYLQKHLTVAEITQQTGIPEKEVEMALKFLVQTPLGLGYSSDAMKKIQSVNASEGILKYKSFNDILKEYKDLNEPKNVKNRKRKKPTRIGTPYTTEQEPTSSHTTSSKANWETIENEFGITKRGFGRKINFVKDPFKRKVIFRDVEQAFVLASSGFSKPAVILAGGVIEELLRLYLKQKGLSPQKPLKKDFNGYIQTCVQNRLLKDSVSHLSDSVREFRNLVHLSAEETRKHTIYKSTAKGAVSSIFTIANDF